MFEDDLFVENDIKSLINEVFPFLDINIYYDPDQFEYYVSISDDKIYYSDEYQMLVMEIKFNYLWKNDLNNYVFVNEKKLYCESISEKISFTKDEEIQFIHWSIDDSFNILLNGSSFTNDFLKAA